MFAVKKVNVVRESRPMKLLTVTLMSDYHTVAITQLFNVDTFTRLVYKI